ncbi:hypothetical protein DSO57_1031920 [Entomophthora muscae]|uniref:Uncharacterized protein n=1 Tax=Entomophthora muscae TaxID=34485 RepID=A0ACC2TMD8_9FUNG|nr:hypothetical protein DSO57_1031920 [Entomophthora muscae]
MLLLLFVGRCVGYSILIHSGMGSRSHVKGMLEVGQALGERGHLVQYVALDDNIGHARHHPNITEVGLGHPEPTARSWCCLNPSARARLAMNSTLNS